MPAVFLLAATVIGIAPAAAQTLPQDIVQKYITESKDVQRIALVIGNKTYARIDELPNGERDANEVAKALTPLGFQVTRYHNLDHDSFVDAIQKFRPRIEPDAIVFFYFSGHGFSINGRNYMAPVDHDPSKKNDLPYTNPPVEWIIEEFRQARYGSIVLVLDSCRSIKPPPSGGLAKGPGGESGSSSFVPPPASKALIAFAAAPANVAISYENELLSIFTGAFAPLLPSPGQDVQSITRSVRRTVHTRSRGQQEPWDNSSLYGPILLNPTADDRRRDEEDWRRVLANPDRDSVTTFIDVNPTSRYIRGARAWLQDNRQTLAKAAYSASGASAAGASNPPTQSRVLQGSLQTSSIYKLGQERNLGLAFPSKAQPIFAGPDGSQKIVGTVDPSKQVRILRAPDASGWAEVESADGKIGFIPNVRELRAAVDPIERMPIDFGAGVVALSESQRKQLSDFGAKYKGRGFTTFGISASASHADSIGAVRQTAFSRAIEVRNALITTGIGQPQISIVLPEAGNPSDLRNTVTVTAQNVKW